ncbi:periplasmic binding protein-like II [Aspergillus steynii IBT 23096]|uniref:Periplasmic binding protein-like II n=1 Tax=Aspergillus steynii IBT 23096 TaxID=1392250 RepID=A0A2I2GG82_9EURO|nr:periplasmic binding protein-like II [Aspergillus steynii IBT 23096]PLB51891.1 periplasmic binding protein-like II [Aspergillus steynii IBT 23096]
MASSSETIRIGYVPEHYLTPLHLALRSPAVQLLPFKLSLIPFPSGTGHMITSLREKEIDIGIGLTEGWVAGLAGKAQAQKDAAEGGYKMVGQWVDTPLRWAIVTGRERDDIQTVADLKNKRVGISRPGSGSHIMSFVLAQKQGWQPDALTAVPLGPFGSLRNGVTGHDDSHPEGKPEPTAEFFMWEQFTTKPYFHSTAEKPDPPLKKFDEIYTPWPSWMVVASTAVFPEPEHDSKLQQLFKLFDQGIQDFEADTTQAVRLLGTGELGCTYTEEDAKEWLKDVKFVQGTQGVDRKMVESVVDVLKIAGVIDSGMTHDEAVERVIGIHR